MGVGAIGAFGSIHNLGQWAGGAASVGCMHGCRPFGINKGLSRFTRGGHDASCEADVGAIARYRTVEPSNGSNFIPRRARPGLAGLGPHASRVQEKVALLKRQRAIRFTGVPRS